MPKENDENKDDIMWENKHWIKLPESIRKEWKSGGVLREHYNKLLKDNYDAMKAHKEYYDKCMAKWGYTVPDPIPTPDIQEEVLFTWFTYLFGWFAYQAIDYIDQEVLDIEYDKNGQPVLDETGNPKMHQKIEKRLGFSNVGRWVLEDSVQKMAEYIEDVKAGKTPRCLRAV